MNSLVNTETSHSITVRAIFHIEEKSIEALRVISFSVDANFMDAHTDFIELEAEVITDEFVNILIPHRDDTLVTIIYDNIDVLSRTFRVEHYADSTSFTHKQQSADNATTKRFTVQLVSSGLNRLNQSLVNGIYESSIEERFKALSKHTENEVVILTPPHNQRIYRQLIIPVMPAIDLIDYAQQRWGVYNSPIGYYLRTFQKKEIFYIYDKHPSVQSVKREADVVTGIERIVITPEDGIEYYDQRSTYAYENNNHDTLRILGGEFVIEKATNINSRVLPARIEGVEADTIYRRPHKVDGTKVEFDVTSVTRRNARSEGAYGVVTKPTSNFYNLRAMAALAEGHLASVTWRFSNAMLLTPMMLVEVIYHDVLYKGTLVGYHTYYDISNETENTKMFLRIEQVKG